MHVGDLFITVNGNTRIAHPQLRWLEALIPHLQALGNSCNGVVGVVTHGMIRDMVETERMYALIDTVIARCGGASIVDLQAEVKERPLPVRVI